ncbi:MAG: asparagine synthetase B, partial [Patescibacteria group bacterium]
MCGIAGFTGSKNDRLLKQLSKDLEHRGPDGEGIYSNGEVTLLNRRLSIIDLTTGDQPIFNEDKSLVIVYNGEIYNYRELKTELKKKNHVFSTTSDTEIALHAYQEWGVDAFDRFNGMFGLAIYDIKKKKLILARDQFGIKPVYFSSVNNKLLFASEIKPIINSGLIEKKVNARILYRYLRFRVHDNERETFFQGVERLLPGEMLTFEKGKMKIEKYSKMDSRFLASLKLRRSGRGN